MPDLTFEIISAEAKPFAAAPTLAFKLRVTNSVADEEVFAAALKGQVMIEAVHRAYDPATQARLLEVFGESTRWDETLNNLFWTNVAVPLPRFVAGTTVELAVACGEDFETSAGKYFYAARDGYVPLAFLFSGTVFYRGAQGAVQVMRVPWEKEAAFKLPAWLWHEMIERYHPDTQWLRLRRETFDQLQRYKALNAFPTFDLCLEQLITRASATEKAAEEVICP